MAISLEPGLADEAGDGGDYEESGRPREFIQSLERGLAIIRAFSREAPTQSVGEIAVRTGLTRATARRFLITLSMLGYVESDGHAFRLTPKVLELGYSYLSGLRFADVAAHRLKRLVEEVDEDSEASILDGDDVVYVARIASTKMMTVPINVGARMPAHATAMGKALLAGLTDEQLDDYLARANLNRFMPNTVTDPEALRTQILQVRVDGFALVDQELEAGLVAVAVPVRDRAGRVVGAVNLSTNVLRRSASAVMNELAVPLRRTANLIEQDLASTA